jgi:hypothetical protein
MINDVFIGTIVVVTVIVFNRLSTGDEILCACIVLSCSLNAGFGGDSPASGRIF